MCEKYNIAGLITEPVLQNIGVVPPLPGYLEGLRSLADEFGFVLIFDEVKTGFRHGFGGYAAIAHVSPDIVVYGKALANGYPIAAIGGRGELMNLFVHPNISKRVLLAGTYNAHPVPTAAAIATLERLLEHDGEVYRHTEALGTYLETCLLQELGEAAPWKISRIGSAFCIYFMDHIPRDWHDVAANHDFELDIALRRRLIENGIYVFPLGAKQWSLSAAHSRADVDETVSAIALHAKDLMQQRLAAKV